VSDVRFIEAETSHRGEIRCGQKAFRINALCSWAAISIIVGNTPGAGKQKRRPKHKAALLQESLFEAYKEFPVFATP
jgi:hypothetical protein